MSQDDLLRRLEAMEARLGVLEDKEEIGRLQRIYGYYIDNRMWREMADLFADEGASMEIGRRGRYLGKARIHRFLEDVLGQGRWGLTRNEIINHMQHQLVISVDPDRRHAQARARAVVQIGPPEGGDLMTWAEGLYENTYVREDGKWKIQRFWWTPTFYVSFPGYESVQFQSGPASESFPPDEPSHPPDERIGRGFPPFHYPHPITGRAVSLHRDGEA